jgi:DNA gyrase/topoisomerase IV subunit A
VDSEDPAYIRQRAVERLRVLDGVLRAIDLGWPLVEAIEESGTKADAHEVLTGPRFGFDEVQAAHILDLQLSRRTKQGRAFIQSERDYLRSLINAL